MAIRKVSRMGHPVLRVVAEPVNLNSIAQADTQRLIDDMLETMDEYHGAGLAAPQVHVSLRILVTQGFAESVDDCEPCVLINPIAKPVDGETETSWEGCLSIPELRGLVRRHTRISVQALDREGVTVEFVAEGLQSRIIQHEVDHLDGILYLDRMEDPSSLCFLDEYRRFWEKDEAEDEEEA